MNLEPLHLVWFAGGGGSSCGAKMHLGRDVDYALNHDAVALRMHEVNHPGTMHMCADAFSAHPEELERGRPIATMWFSPDCTHHSKARGSAPKSDRIRGLCWCIVPWARRSAEAGGPPAVIFIENVGEFRDYGRLFPEGHPQAGQADPADKGALFAEFNRQLQDAGFVGEWRELVVANYSSPKLSPEGGETTRKRLFAIFRSDGLPIVWPEQTNAPRQEAEAKGLKPWAPAASFIDFDLPCPSIFMSQDDAKAQGLRVKRPLSPATRKRIARGVERYVIAAAEPFIFPLTHQGDARVHGVRDPLRTVTSAHRGEFGLGAAHLGRQFGSTVSGRNVRHPHPAVMSDGGGGKSQLVASYLTMFNENSIGRLPDEPLHTVMAGATRHGLVAAFLNTYYATGVGSDLGLPVRTVTGEDRHAFVSAFMEQANTDMVGHDLRRPLSTIVGKGCTQRLVEARLQAIGAEPGSRRRQVLDFLWEHFGEPTEDEWADPAATLQARLRFGLVLVGGQLYEIADIGMRMLTVRELFSAQTFPRDYIIDRDIKGRPITGTAATLMCGNAVPPLMAYLLYACNWPKPEEERVAA